MLFYILLFITLYKVYDLFTRKYLNPFALYFLYGAKGSGKTITETKLAVKYLHKGWAVYTDMPELLIPGVRFFEWNDLGDYVPEEDSILILSEVGTKFDKRNYKNFTDNQRDFFIFQRKYKTIVYMDSQSFDVDLKIRDRTDCLFLCHKVGRLWSIAKRISIVDDIVQPTADSDGRMAKALKIAPFWTWMVTYIPAWCDLYDTDYVIGKKPYLNYKEVPDLPSGANFQ